MNNRSMLLGVIMVLLSFPVMAYIDPSSGSAIISAIIGVFVALSMTIKTYWYKIKSFFAGDTKPNDGKEIKKDESTD
jgi:hypothetical protein